MKFDPHQLHAVQAIQRPGNLRIKATAGSGKTAVLIEGIAQRVQGGQDPREIAAVTFTAAGGEVLRSRLAKQCPQAVGATVGTFHAIGGRTLRAIDPGRWKHSRCTDVSDGEVPKTRQIWDSILEWSKDGIPGLPGVKSLNIVQTKDQIGDYILEVECARSSGLEILTEKGEVDQDVYRWMVALDPILPKIADAWVMYAQAKRALQAYDFQDVLYHWLQGLKNFTISSPFTFVAVDEAQDNSKVQLDIAIHLAKGKLVLIGDGSQSIYGWRGATPEIFLQAKVEDVALPNNYRSSPSIVQAGNILVTPLETKLEAVAMSGRRGEIRPITAETTLHEAHCVAEEIGNLISHGASPADFAILLRTQSACGPFEGELTRRKIPVFREGGVPFFERWDVLAFIGYAILTRFDSFPALERVYNMPKRYLSREFLKQVGEKMTRPENAANWQSDPLLQIIRQVAQKLNAQSRERGVGLAQSLEQRRQLPFSEAMDDIANLLARGTKASERDLADDRVAVPQVCAQIAKGLGTVENLVAYADAAAANVTKRDDNKPRVTITTVHRAKAREWKHVYVSMPAGTFPHKKAATPERLEEERRLAYVAVTRGMESVTITFPVATEAGTKVGPGVFAREIFGWEK